ncbi:MAG TPA: YcaO-like family protein [Candidatus Obscuribacterales bacterium]
MLLLPLEHDPGPLAWVLDWVDDRFGPLTGLSGARLSVGRQPHWWLYNCSLSRPVGVHFTDHPIRCSGASIDGSVALKRALGEAIERYCWYDSQNWYEVEVLPASECSVIDVLPACAGDEPCAPGLKGISPSCTLRQTRVNKLSSGERVWLPAGYVHAGLIPRNPEPHVTIPVSTGAAFSDDLVKAIWSGLCEVAERDALMLCWLNQIPAPRIAIDAHDCPLPLFERLSLLSEQGLSATFWDISTDFLVPTVLCLVRAGQYPYQAVGVACCTDPLEALCKGLDEAIMVRAAHSKAIEKVSLPSTADFGWMTALEDHGSLYAAWQGTAAFDFLLADNQHVTDLSAFMNRAWWQRPQNMEQLRAMALRCEEELHCTILWADITSDEVRGRGTAVKVVVPEMVPLAVASARWLASTRLIRHAERNGRSRPGINPYPHPFP